MKKAAVGTLTSAVGTEPEALAFLAAVSLGAGWATHLGTLPGQGRRSLGVLVEVLAWASLYAGLGRAYCAAAFAERASARGVRPRIGLCLVLALLSTQVCNLLSATIIGPWVWHKLFYLSRLVPPAFVAFWCAALLPRETRGILRAARASPTTAPLPHLAVLLASAAILVSCGDLAFEWSGGSPVGSALKVQVITKEAWGANVLILFSAYAFAFAVTSRVTAALLVVTLLYAGLGLATLAKIRYMHSAVQPLDVIRLGEFLPLFRSFFGTGVLAATAVGLGLWIGALVAVRRLEPCPMSAVRRWATGLVSLVLLAGIPFAYFVVPAPWVWQPPPTTSPSPAKLLRYVVLRSVLGRDRDREFREMARVAGFLRSFISELPAAFVSTPADYSPAAIARVVRQYCSPDVDMDRAQQTNAGGRPGRVNLVVYMVESFMDPDDLGLRYTSDPIPNVRAFRKAQVGGYAVVPERFGGSPSTEFETLTGMTTAFLPEGSVAYRLYLKHPIPSLSSTLADLGYATTMVRADPRYFYGHETAYPLLGFDRVVWLDDSPGVERGPRGLWPSDKAVVEAIIQASHQAHPFFVFAFASSTHSPYNQGTYRDSDLDVLDAPTRDAAGEVKEYINALRVADQAIGTLVDYYRRQPDSTIVVVLGDHLPPLSDDPLRTFFLRSSGMSVGAQALMHRRVPLLVWANFGLAREEKELSTNALPSYLLEKMGIPPTGFLAVSEAVARRVSIFGRYVQSADGSRLWHRDSLPDDERSLLGDYRLLQYDLLLGKRYSLAHGTSEASHCGGAAQSRQVAGPQRKGTFGPSEPAMH